MIHTTIGDLRIEIPVDGDKPTAIKAHLPAGKMYLSPEEIRDAAGWVGEVFELKGWGDQYGKMLDEFEDTLALHGTTELDDDRELPTVIHLNTTPPPPAWLPGKLHPLWPIAVRFKSELITALVLIVLAYLGVDHLGSKQAEQTELLREQNGQLMIQNKLAREELLLRKAEAEYWQIPVPTMQGDQP